MLINKIQSIKIFNNFFQIFRLSSKKYKIYLLLTGLTSLVVALFEMLLLLSFLNFANSLLGVASNDKFAAIFNFINTNNQNNVISSSFILIVAVTTTSIMKITNLTLIKRVSAYLAINLANKFYSNQLYSDYLSIKNKSISYYATIESKSILAIVEILSIVQISCYSFFALIIILLTNIFLFGNLVLIPICLIFLSYFLIIRFTKNRFLKNSYIINSNISEQINLLSVLSNDFKFIILSGLQKEFINTYKKREQQTRILESENFLFSQMPKFIIEAIGLSIIAIIAVFISLKTNENTNALAILGIIAVSFLRSLPTLQQLYVAWTDINSHFAPAETILAEISNVPIKKNRNLRIKRGEIMKKSFELNNVSFKYPSKKENIINNFSLNIKKGDYIGIVGKSGKGKTTLIDIISGFLKVDKGEIKIDGKELLFDSEKMIRWQRQISIVSQEVYLKKGSFLSNLVPNVNEYDKKRLDYICKISQIYEDIKNTKFGYNSKILERGSNLSGGQRQRLNLARALYCSPSLLILDEYTSSIDPLTEMKILNELKKLKGSMTIVVISHKKETLIDCDSVIELV